MKVRSIKELIKIEGFKFIISQVEKAADSLKISMIKGLGSVGSDESLNYLHTLTLSKNTKNVIEESYRQLGKSWGGEEYVIKLATQNEIPKEYLSIALEGPLKAWRRPIQSKAREFLNAPEEIDKGYSISELSGKSGNPDHGKTVFTKNCATCHMIGKEGISFGPALSEIGSKYAKPEIYQSILEPSRSINFGYEGEQIITKNGGIYVGIKVNEDSNLLTLKMVGGALESIDKKNIKERIKLKQSLMTPNLYQNMTEQELIDLTEYLSTNKKSI